MLGIKTTQILIYSDNFASINYLIHTHWFELKFLGVGTTVLIGAWLRKALKYIEPHKLQALQTIPLFSLAIAKIVLQLSGVPFVFRLLSL